MAWMGACSATGGEGRHCRLLSAIVAPEVLTFSHERRWALSAQGVTPTLPHVAPAEQLSAPWHTQPHPPQPLSTGLSQLPTLAQGVGKVQGVWKDPCNQGTSSISTMSWWGDSYHPPPFWGLFWLFSPLNVASFP